MKAQAGSAYFAQFSRPGGTPGAEVSLSLQPAPRGRQIQSRKERKPGHGEAGFTKTNSLLGIVSFFEPGF